MTASPQAILALDVGDKRIGVAIANISVRFASPLTTITNDEMVWQQLTEIIETNDVGAIVVGLPRGLDGQETAQTHKAEVFMQQLRAHLGLPVHPQDEAATSVKAEEELAARGKPYAKGEVDALAATYILEDYLNEQGGSHGL